MSRWLSVFSVKEYAFCPRAGVLAANELAGEDDGMDDSLVVPQLTFKPCFDLLELDRELARIKEILLFLVYPVLGTVVVFLLLLFLGLYLYAFFLLAILSGTIIKFSVHLVKYLELREERDNYKRIEGFDISTLRNERHDVDWWQLIKAGWRKTVYTNEKVLSHNELRLSGKPAMALWKDREIIPVVVRSQELIEPFSNHVQRLALYSIMLTDVSADPSENRVCRWGLFLSGETKKGYLIPINDEQRRRAKTILEKFRSDLDANSKPPAPQRNLCVKCPWGKPTTDDPTPKKQQVDNYRVLSRKGTPFRSDCGDHFKWIPPHKSALSLDLKNETDYFNS